MLIEEFIRIGQALLESAPRPEKVLRLVTDVTENTIKNFYRNVFVVDVPAGDEGEVSVLNRQEFGEEDENGNFTVYIPQALGAPITLPAGGNPLQAQGRYGLPVYPCYDPHLRAFQESVNGAREFLQSRLPRTANLLLSPQRVEEIAQRLHERMNQNPFGPDRVLGVLVLARCGEGEFYSRIRGSMSPHRIGRIDEEEIVPDLPRILEAVLAARVEEGRGAARALGKAIAQ